MRKISRIQLRGISRSPSDRLTEDGGLAESLNVHIVSGETAPIVKPEDVTEALGIPTNFTFDRLFVHKTTSYKNYIFTSVAPEATNGAIYIGFINNGVASRIITLGEGESVNDITSIGNTLIVSTSSQMYYLLYKDQDYVLLGNKIPFPTIEFFDAEVKAKKPTSISGGLFTTNITYAYDLDIFDDVNGASVVDGIIIKQLGSDFDNVYGACLFKPEVWGDLSARHEHNNERIKSTFDEVKTKWQQMIVSNAEDGIFSNSFWAIYAIRLYDGSLITSVPQLLSPGEAEPVEVCGLGKWEGFSEPDGYLAFNEFLIRLNKCFRLGIRLHDFPTEVIESWKDIIKSIDIFISEDVVSTDYTSMIPTGEVANPVDNIYMSKFNMKRSVNESFFSSAISKSAFVKVEQFTFSESYDDTIKNVDLLRSDYVCDSKTYVLNTDRFSGKELLSSNKYDIKQSSYIADSFFTYNNRLYLIGNKELLAPGTRWFNSQRFSAYLPRPIFGDYPIISWYPQGWFINPWRYGEEILINGTLFDPANIIVNIAYYIQDNNGSSVVYGKTSLGSTDFQTVYSRYTLNKPEVGSLFIYPNPNCRYADIQVEANGTIYRKRVSMEPHPFLPNCSYWYGGDNSLLSSVMTFSDFDSMESESPIINQSNKLIFTDTDNPFIYPIGSSVSLDSAIIGVAVATTALSQGQFGQFPLYVFTEDGIWGMEAASDGSLVTSKPISRDVCINARSITSIDNAVIFVTSKGVMMLRGSEVVNVSPYMNGKHYAIENGAMAIINGQPGFCECGDVLSDTTPFMTFIKDARAAYDYPGKRLIFINPSEAYQYIYKLDTQTWHKTYHQHIKNMSYAINSYPECFVPGLYSDDRYMYYAGVQSSANSTEVLETLQRYLPNLTINDVESYLNMAGGIDITDLPEESAYPVYMYLTHEFSTNPIGKTYNIIHLYDLSTHLDTSLEQQTERGVIATRPFDMNEPDVLKTITDIRIRGQYSKGAVKFILLGSNDGIHFYTISTLRGKAWKMFRLIILADLAPTERISWVDVMYESRFTNKLR